MNTDIVLQLTNVFSGYDDTNVIKDVTFSVSRGSIVTIVGPNGHGKSTLLKTISGLVSVRSGNITLNGKPLSRQAFSIARQGVCHVPQGDLLFPDMTVLENLKMGAHGKDRSVSLAADFEEVFEYLPKLAERRNQLASTLSGGERRMVGIGRGMMMKDEIVLLDEPSLGLAPLVIDQIYEVIGKLVAAGRTILLVEENPMRVELIAQEIHLLDDGHLTWSGTHPELLQRGNLLNTYLGG